MKYCATTPAWIAGAARDDAHAPRSARRQPARPGRTRPRAACRPRRAPAASSPRRAAARGFPSACSAELRPSRRRRRKARSRAPGAATVLPSRSTTRTLLRRTSATSPSSRKMKRRVTGSSAATSDATKFSSSPRPMTTGQPSRASTSRSGSACADHRERVGALEFGHRGTHRLEQVVRASSGGEWMRCAMTSVSVSEVNA